LAVLNDKVGKFRESEEFYRKALARSPGDSEPYNGPATNAFRWWTPRKERRRNVDGRRKSRSW
jgi:hypothetical protein